MGTGADVCLVLEGTYPFVAGGVSSWVHGLIRAFDRRRFALLHIGPHEGAYQEPTYPLGENIVGLTELHCHARPGGAGAAGGRRRRNPRDSLQLLVDELRRRATGDRQRAAPAPPSRTLHALRRIHTEDTVDDELVADLAAADLSVSDFLHGDPSFDLFHQELYPRLASGTPFTDFFWHMRAMHVPLLRLLGNKPPPARVYHAVSTGYAGVVSAVASHRTGRPMLLTEHGLYARERDMELARAAWIRDPDDPGSGLAAPSPLRRLWSRFFLMLSRVAYHQSRRIITLSEVNRVKQLEDGADPHKVSVVPNGVDLESYRELAERREQTAALPRPLRVGFVGRVVPIKDVVTLVRAIAIAAQSVDLELWVVGPEDEDPAYAARCHQLVDALGLGERIKFLGRRDVREIYPDLDVVVLTSLSEGQPLVIIEAHAAGVPVVASDVGACRELLEGRGTDRALGPSGIVTRVANPEDTAHALVRMARGERMRRQMGRAGRARVAAHYRLDDVIDRYAKLYDDMVALD